MQISSFCVPDNLLQYIFQPEESTHGIDQEIKPESTNDLFKIYFPFQTEMLLISPPFTSQAPEDAMFKIRTEKTCLLAILNQSRATWACAKTQTTASMR